MAPAFHQARARFVKWTAWKIHRPAYCFASVTAVAGFRPTRKAQLTQRGTRDSDAFRVFPKTDTQFYFFENLKIANFFPTP